MTTPRAVGIDLGTTYSVVACLDPNGRSEVVRSIEGELLTPSVVYFDESETVVGKAAKHFLGIESEKVADCVKRDMGSPYYSKPINGQRIPPEVIQACILRKLKGDAEATVGPDFKVVITVPAYFDEPRRKATADAGEMAGLDVLDIVNEPTAAALAFGEQLGYLTATGDPLGRMNVLVYDLGGGTFDVTIISLAPGDVRTLATDGDVQLGGRDWDQAIVDFAAEAAQAQLGLDVLQDAVSAGKLVVQVEEAKHTLSQRDRAVIRVEHGGRVVDVPITRLEFEQLTEGLLERTSFTTRQVIAAAGLTWKDISRVLLVGGSTRMPMVSSMIRQLSGITPDRSINPDEAVARGAAIFAGYQLSKKNVGAAKEFQVTDVNSHSLGIQGIDQGTLRRENIIVIPKNTPLPANVTRQFVTQSDGQKSIVVQVLEGESPQPNLCSRIGRSVLRQLPPDLPRGYPVHVTFSYGTNGRLNVEAALGDTNCKAQIELEREQGLTAAQLQRWRQVFTGGMEVPNSRALLSEALEMSEVPAPSAGQPGAPQTNSPSPAKSAAGAAVPQAVVPEQSESDPAMNPMSGSIAGAMQSSAGAGAEPSEVDSQSERLAYERKQRLIKRVIFVCGHVVFAALGLVLGYYILCSLRPEADFLKIFTEK